MSHLLAKLDQSALALIKKDFQGGRVSIQELATILFTRLSEDLNTALAVVDIFDGIEGPSLSWTEFLDFLTKNSKQPAGQSLVQAANFHLELAANVLMDTTRHGGPIQAVRAKLGGDFQLLTAEAGVPGLQVYRKTAEHGVVRVPGERIIPDILLKLPDEFGSSGEYCTDFACTEMISSGTFAGEIVAATINRRAVVVWEHGGGYKSQLRGLVTLKEGGDRIWWSKKLSSFLVSLQMQSRSFQVVLLDPVTMTLIGTLPRTFEARVQAISDVRSIAGAEFLTVVEESGKLTLLALSREDPRVNMEISSIVDLKRKIMSCELGKTHWMLGCLDGSVVVFDPVNSLTVRILQEHKTSVSCLTVIKDHLVTREDCGDLILWSLKTYTPVQKVTSIHFSIKFMIALERGLLLTASETRFFFMKNSIPSVEKFNKHQVRCVLFDSRYYRLLIVSSEVVSAIDLSINTVTSLLACPGIAAAALETTRGMELAVAASGTVKIMNLSSGELEDECGLQESDLAIAMTFVGQKLAILFADGLLAIFAAGRRLTSRILSAEFRGLAPISADGNNCRLLIWTSSGEAIVVRETARVGNSVLSVEGSIAAPVGALVVGPIPGERDGLLLSDLQRVYTTEGEVKAERACGGPQAMHICQLTTHCTSTNRVSKSVVEKFDEAVTFGNKKTGCTHVSDQALETPATNPYNIVAESGTGKIRVFLNEAEFLSIQDEPRFDHVFPVNGHLVTVRDNIVRMWSVSKNQLVFEATHHGVKINALLPHNPVKKQLALKLAKMTVNKDLEEYNPPNSNETAPSSPIACKNPNTCETTTLSSSPSKRRDSRRSKEILELPRTPRTLSHEFLKSYLLRESSGTRQKTELKCRSHLEEELDIVDEQYLIKKENVVVEEKKKDCKLSTKLAYSVSGSVYRKMSGSMKVSDFVTQYSKVLSRRATPQTLSRISTAPTRTATAMKPSRSS